MITVLLASFFNLGATLPTLMTSYGAWIYGILFLLIFAETGLVIMPFLPGDSILFLLGSLAAFTHSISITKIIFILSLVATIGDLVNFKLGQHFGRPD